MIHDPRQLAELIDEVAEKPLEWRRSYIASIRSAFGDAAAQQIKDALTARWTAKD